MTKTSSEIYGPVLDIIRKLKDASPEEKDILEQELVKVAEKAHNDFQIFDNEFNSIQDANIELEEKIRNLNELIDKKMEETSFLDMEDSLITCSIIYKGFWNKLDKYSQKYLAMANYLYKLLAYNGESKDISPSVLEYGRAVENELIKKIYSSYIGNLSEHASEIVDDRKLYKSIKNAVNNHKDRASFYIPARDMVRYLSYVSNSKNDSPYILALKVHLENQHIDVDSISDNSFTSIADELFDKYRNAAAHSGTTLSSSDAEACREKTKKVLKKYMSAVGDSTTKGI